MSPAPQEPTSSPTTRPAPRRWAPAFTMFELAAVVVVLTVVAGLAVSAAGDATTQATRTVTMSTMRTVRDALVGVATGREGRVTPCFLQDVGRLPRFAPTSAGDYDYSLTELLDGRGLPAFDPGTQRGWRGPYLIAPIARFGTPDLELGLVPAQWVRYGQPGDSAVRDGYGRPLLLQVPDDLADGTRNADDERHARLVSAGPDGRIDTPLADRYPSLSQCGDDLVLYLRVADLRP